MSSTRKGIHSLVTILVAAIMIVTIVTPALAQRGPEIRVTDSETRADQPDVAVDSNGNVHIAYSDEVESWYQTFGTSPNRYTVIEWHTASADSEGPSKFQVILYENNGNIDINIADNTGADWVGSTAITGVNKDGTDGVDIGGIPPSNSSYRFTWNVSSSDYNWSAIAYNWIELSASGTTVGAQDDDSSAAVPIGFDFTFYGTSYDTVYVSSNGYMSFTDTDADESVAPGSFPSGDAEDANVISPLWEDWTPEYRHIWYTMLDNNGNTLIGNTMISAAVDWDAVRPAIGVDSDDMVHIIWHDERWDDSSEIAYTKLDPSQDDRDGGAADEAAITVVDDTRLTDLLKDYQRAPRMAVDSKDNIHIVWEDGYPWSGGSIYYMQIDRDGNELVAETVIRPTSYYENVNRASPDVAVDSNDNPHITWNDNEDTDANETYYMMLDGSSGATLIDATLISPDNDQDSRGQSIVVDGEDKVHIIWKDQRYVDDVGGYYNSVYYTKLDPSLNTQDGDAADPSEITLIDDKAVSGYYDNYSVKQIASAIACGRYIHLSWWEKYTEDLYYMVLDTDGNTVVAETALTTTGSVTTSKGGSGVSGWMVPYLDVDSNGKAHITWVDDRDDLDPAPPDEAPDFVEVYYTGYEGPPCEPPTPSAPPGVPALSQWGAIGMIIALAGCIVWTLRRRRLA